MKKETTISTDIRTADSNMKYDAACKRLLSHKPFLAVILKSCVEEFGGCDVREIAEKYIEGIPQISEIPVHPDESNRKTGSRIHGLGTEDKTMTEGTVTYDIRFTALAPISGERIKLIINLEAQSVFYPGYPLTKRGIYYCCRLISAQRETEFTGDDYGAIKKVYSIWICLEPPKKRQNTITLYQITENCLAGESRMPRNTYDLLTMAILCLGNPVEGAQNDALRMLDVLFSQDIRQSEKRRILEEEFQIPMTEEIESEVNSMYGLGDAIEARGLEKGLEKGILLSVQNLMKNMDLSMEAALTALSVPKERWDAYIAMAQEQNEKQTAEKEE